MRHALFKEENILTNFKIFLLQNRYASFNLTLQDHSCEKGIQVTFNKGLRPFPRGDNYDIAKTP